MAIVRTSPTAAAKYVGLSTDTKPTGNGPGSVPPPKPGDWFVETDTGFVYTYGLSGWSVKLSA